MIFIKRVVLAVSIAAVTMLSSITTVHADSDLPLVAGEVKKVKPGKITIKHEEIPNLDMPGMTMVFRVDDDAIISEMKKGDKVQFTVEERDGKMYIVAIEAATE